MNQIISNHKPTHIVHTTYMISPIHDYNLENKIDIEGSKNLLISANQAGSVKQIVFFSSARVYCGHSDNKLWLSEDSKLRPKDYPYGMNKVKVEKIYPKYNKRDDVKQITKLILEDSDIQGVFNLAPDSFATDRELAPEHTLFIKISEKN